MSEDQISYDSPHLTPLKENNLQYKPSQQQVLSYAEEVLQLNLLQDSDLIFLAEEALIAPLPQNWEACQYFAGQDGFNELNGNIAQEETLIVYRNKLTKKVTYDHPLDFQYRQKARKLKLMKNTAKYSQNITPISQELIQSSLLFQKNNSKKQNSQSVDNNSSSNNFSSNFEDSKSKLFNQVNSKASDFVKNITQESMPFEDEENFSNLSMITDNDHEQNDNQAGETKQIRDKIIKNTKVEIDSRVEKGRQRQMKKVDIKKLMQKPSIIHPIIVPNQKDKSKQRQKQNERRKATEIRMREIITKRLLQKLSQIHEQKMVKLKNTVKESISLKEVQEKIMIARQFPELQSFQIKSGVDLMNKKLEQLKLIERQNKVMDQKIQQLMKMIDFESKL